MSEKLKEFVEIPQEFIHDGQQFLTRCTKPSRKEFVQISKAVAIGFAVMGFIGYFVKLIHIPINNILVSAEAAHNRQYRSIRTSSVYIWGTIYFFSQVLPQSPDFT
ncbi:hypothetical protein ONZ51_g3528 [Trametes cubensis]|uniref:Uncharacterized protein n=1 Tax=Trametes cubensis TaxID=1111947 RepID=A0AAD7U037_9APHY|nr:hypothetical protein ONZ51_g3528 [Trametes cubensis]